MTTVAIVWRGSGGFYRRGTVDGTDVAVVYPHDEGWVAWVADGPPGGRDLPGVYPAAEAAMRAAEAALTLRGCGGVPPHSPSG